MSKIIGLPGGAEDTRPLPLIVAERWGFPLQYYIVDGQPRYSVLDWIKGIAESDPRRVSFIWGQSKKQLLISDQQLPYLAAARCITAAPSREVRLLLQVEVSD